MKFVVLFHRSTISPSFRSETELLDEKIDSCELFKGLGHALDGRLEIHPAVVLRHMDEKKHSRWLLSNASYGMHPTFSPGMTKTGGGEGSIIVKMGRICAAHG
jgi:hypothetical protein